jgi:hypothetical protein
MRQKMMRSREQLQTIVLGELRTHAECSDVRAVTVSRLREETWRVKNIKRQRSDACRTMEQVVAQLNTAYGLAKERAT